MTPPLLVGSPGGPRARGADSRGRALEPGPLAVDPGGPQVPGPLPWRTWGMAVRGLHRTGLHVRVRELAAWATKSCL